MVQVPRASNSLRPEAVRGEMAGKNKKGAFGWELGPGLRDAEAWLL